MKKAKYFLFFIAFSFLLLNNVEAAFKCAIDGYNVEYDNDTINLYKNDKLIASNHSTSNEVHNFIVADVFKLRKKADCSNLDNAKIIEGSVYYLFENDTEIDANKLVTADKVSCGDFKKIPRKIPELTSWAVTFIQVLVPVILVIMSMVDLVKAMSSQKEDEIKKGQKVLIKRIVLAVIIFLFVALVKLVISIVANTTDTNNIVSCISCFIDGNCK